MSRPARGRGDALLRRLHARRTAVGTRIDVVAYRISFAAESALDAELRDLLGDDAVDLAGGILVSGSRRRRADDGPRRLFEDLFRRGKGLA